jgi:hypothetical protein
MPMSTIHLLPEDATSIIFAYAAIDDLFRLRSVCKVCCHLVDTLMPFPEYAVKAKEAYAKLLKTRTTWEGKLFAPIDAKLQELQEELSKSRTTKDARLQTKLEGKLATVQSQRATIKNLAYRIPTIYSNKEAAYGMLRVRFAEERKKITALFGGDEAFEKLPVIQRIDEIMPASMMRGIHQDGTEFFMLAIRKKHRLQIDLFQQDTKTGVWGTGDRTSALCKKRSYEKFTPKDLEILHCFISNKQYNDWAPIDQSTDKK